MPNLMIICRILLKATVTGNSRNIQVFKGSRDICMRINLIFTICCGVDRKSKVALDCVTQNASYIGRIVYFRLSLVYHGLRKTSVQPVNLVVCQS